MGLESSPTVIDDLNSAWPLGTDQAATSDDHHRNIKSVLTAVFAGIEGVAGAGPLVDAFASGTLMLFQQTAAPIGWTKETAHNNKALRIVTGTVGSGGSQGFTTVFAKSTTDNYALALADIPAHDHGSAGTHSHTISRYITTGSSTTKTAGVNTAASWSSDLVTDNAGAHTHTSVGGGGFHKHTMDIRVLYVDFIIASKD